jgi:hypothetical protein
MLSSFSSETNLTMGGGEGKQIISLHLVRKSIFN